MRSRDLAKIDQLVLDGGEWGGRRIVSAHWIDESIAAHIGAPDSLYFYGYQWRLGRSLVRGREVVWAAGGYGGQRPFVVPALELAAVVTAGRYGEPMQGYPLLSSIATSYRQSSRADIVDRNLMDLRRGATES